MLSLSCSLFVALLHCSLNIHLFCLLLIHRRILYLASTDFHSSSLSWIPQPFHALSHPVFTLSIDHSSICKHQRPQRLLPDLLSQPAQSTCSLPLQITSGSEPIADVIPPPQTHLPLLSHTSTLSRTRQWCPEPASHTVLPLLTSSRSTTGPLCTPS